MKDLEINGHPRFKLGRDTYSWAVFEMYNTKKVEEEGADPEYRMIKWPGLKPEHVAQCLLDRYVNKALPNGAYDLDKIVEKLNELQEWLTKNVEQILTAPSS